MGSSKRVCAVAFAVALGSACRSSPILTITLTNASFATTGFNLFNCTTPNQPADPQSLNTSGIECNPVEVGKGVYSGAVVTGSYQLGCGDGNAAVLVVSCEAADGGSGNAFSGIVALGIAPSCRSTDGGIPNSAQGFVFTALGPGASQSQVLSSCANYDNVCPTSDPCVFNSLKAEVTVTNALVPTQ